METRSLITGFIEILSVCLQFATHMDVPMTLLPNSQRDAYTKCLSKYFESGMNNFIDQYIIARKQDAHPDDDDIYQPRV